MIVRMWKGPVPKAKGDAYEEYLKKTGLADYRTIEGNKGVYLLRRDLGDQYEFLTLSFWDSLDSIMKFSGVDYMRARYYPEDKDYLTVFEPLVSHFEVILNPDDIEKMGVVT